VRVLSEREFMEQWIRFFGIGTGSALLGWCVMSVVGAPRDADHSWLIQHGALSPATRYRNVARLRAFAAHLESQGLAANEVKEGKSAPYLRAERMVEG
jgi:hypothetical protein